MEDENRDENMDENAAATLSTRYPEKCAKDAVHIPSQEYAWIAHSVLI